MKSELTNLLLKVIKILGSETFKECLPLSMVIQENNTASKVTPGVVMEEESKSNIGERLQIIRELESDLSKKIDTEIADLVIRGNSERLFEMKQKITAAFDFILERQPKPKVISNIDIDRLAQLEFKVIHIVHPFPYVDEYPEV